MDYLGLGDKIDYETYNGLVYLLRKFKRLTSDLKLGSTTIESDYGSYSFSGGLTSVGGNYIIESPVTISSSDVLKNCFYSFVFNVVDVNLSGEVNRREVRVTGVTGENGVLEVTLPTDLIESDEVILPDFSVDIVFDPHEYYTPVSSLNIALSVDNEYIKAGETATITALVTDDSGEPIENLLLSFNINGSVESATTDSGGEASVTYTGIGTVGKVTVDVNGEVLVFYDGGVLAEYTGTSIQLGATTYVWLRSNGNVVIDWGDGNTDTVNNPTTSLSHIYTDGESNHDITLIGDITTLGKVCFGACTGLTSVTIPNTVTTLETSCFNSCTDLTSIVIPNSVTTLEYNCFANCTGLTSVTIPSSVNYIGGECFSFCDNLIDYQLYWETPPNTWNNTDMPNNTNTVFTIPEETTSNYVNKNYPLDKLVERGDKTITVLSLSSDKSTLYTDESVTFTGVLTDDEDTPIGNASVKLYRGTVLVDTLTTDSDGEYSKTVSGLSAGSYGFKAVYDGDSTYRSSQSSIVNVTVQNHTYSLSISASPSTTTYGNNVVVSGTLKKDNVAYGSQTVTIYDGDTSLGTATTDSSGNYSKTLTGLTVGSHSIKAVHTQAQSSTVPVTITKLSSVTSLTAVEPLIVVGDAPEVTGTLTSGGVGLTGASVKIYEDGSLVDTVTTSTGGAFSYTGSATSTTGSLTFKAVFDGDANHTGSESSVVTVTVTAPLTPDTITISGTSIIQTGDVDTITATLLAGSTAVASETLSYTVKHGSTTIDSGSDTTDSNGEIEISYTGTGIGDVDVIVSYGTSLQETYVVEDCWKYYPLTDNSHQSAFTIPSGVSVSYSNSGMRLSANAYKQIKLTDKLTTDCSVEFTVSDYSNYAGPAVIVYAYTNGETTPNKNILLGGSSSTNQRSVFGVQLDHDLIKGGKYRIEYTSSTLKVYENNVLLGSASNNVGFSTRFEWHMGADGRYAIYKDLKVKAL